MRRHLPVVSSAVALAVLGWFAWHSIRQPVEPAAATTDENHSSLSIETAATSEDATGTAPVAAVAASTTSSAALSHSPSEAMMMDRLRATLGKGTPQATLDLARDIERSYPDGAQAQERSLYAIDALIALNRITEMRDEARRHLEKWPGTPTSARVMARTGVHPELRPPPGYQ